MKRFRFIVLLAIIILALTSCIPGEMGTILFTSPSFGQIISDDFLEDSPTIPLVVSSTFQIDKAVQFSVNKQESFSCLVKANAIDQECPPVTLTVPGEYTITAETILLDGTITTSEVQFSWIPQETGTILFISPILNEVIRDGYRGILSQDISVRMSSTFRRDKIVRYGVDGHAKDAFCLVKANAIDQECPPVTLTVPGEYTITASTELINGSFTTSGITFSWQPYTKLDRVMLGLSYTSSPVGGYLMVLVFIVGVVTVLAWMITGNQTIVVVSDAVVLALIALSLFFLPSNGQTIFVGCWLAPFLVVMISVAIWMVRFPKPGLIVRRSDGTPVSFVFSPFSLRKNTLEIEADQLNKEFVFQKNPDGGEDGHKNPV